MSPAILLAASLAMITPQTTTGLPEGFAGQYTAPRMFCDEGKAGQRGGPVEVTKERLEIAGMSCELDSWTLISRMDAALVDASCSEGKTPPVATRMFFNRSPEGLTIVSREYGTFTLSLCPSE